MALGTTNIALSAVRTLLGYVTDWSLFNIGTSTLINKWSKYKPIRDAGVGTNWPAGTNSKYGLSPSTNWSYLQPRGGAPGGSPDEPVRLGDFRGYEHDTALAFPTIHSLASEETVRNLHPINTPWTNSWKIRVYRAASSVLILPADFGYDDYYIGVKIWGDNVNTSYKTFGKVNTYVNTGTTLEISAAIDVEAFENLPHGYGTYNYLLFISATEHVNWTAFGASPPTDLIQLIDEGVYNSTGTFDVSTYIYAEPPNFSWNAWESGSGDGDTFTMYTFNENNFTFDTIPANFIVKDDGGTTITATDIGGNTDVFTVYPTADYTNTSTDRTEYIVMTSVADASATFTIPLVHLKVTAPTEAPSTMGVTQSGGIGTPLVLTCTSVVGATGYKWSRRPKWTGSAWDNAQYKIRSSATTTGSDDVTSDGEGFGSLAATAQDFYYTAYGYNGAGDGPATSEFGPYNYAE